MAFSQCCSVYSWHLMAVLSSLGYNNLSPAHQASICVSYASQLESVGLWHWAIFVLCHLYDYERYVFVQILSLTNLWHNG
jgi:hypothetical protein